jgi:hypothetical protein
LQGLRIITDGAERRVTAGVENSSHTAPAADQRVVAMLSSELVIMVDHEAGTQRTAAQGTQTALLPHQVRELLPVEPLALGRGLSGIRRA